MKSDIIALLDNMKRTELQIEYLDHRKKLESLMDSLGFGTEEAFEDADALYARITEVNQYAASVIPTAILDFLNEQEYEVFTADNYGRSYWNEIRLPKFTAHYFSHLQKMVCGSVRSEGESGYAMDLYDMSEGSLYFGTLEEAEAFAASVDCAPATLFRLVPPSDGEELGYAEEVWTI